MEKLRKAIDMFKDRMVDFEKKTDSHTEENKIQDLTMKANAQQAKEEVERASRKIHLAEEARNKAQKEKQELVA